MKRTAMLFLLVCICYSCTDEKDGDWNDKIKLSTKELQFSALDN